MGADLLIAGAWTRHDTVLDFEAGRRAVALLTDAELTDWADAAGHGLDEEDPAGIRAAIVGHVHVLQGAFTGTGPALAEYGGHFRDAATVVSPDGRWVFHFGGGTSWGEDPGPTFTAFNDLGYAPPAVLRAIGFLTDAEQVLAGG